MKKVFKKIALTLVMSLMFYFIMTVGFVTIGFSVWVGGGMR